MLKVPVLERITKFAECIASVIALLGIASSAFATDPPAFSTPVESCIIPAAQYHAVNHHILRAILKTESNLTASAVGRNSNGSIDLGIGQINSVHLAELAKYGIGPAHLRDACIGTYVAAWHLRKAVNERGNTWEGIASYHSRTPFFNHRYQILIYNELVKAGVVPGQLQPVPSLAKSAGDRAAPRASTPTSPRNDDSNVVVFEQRTN